MKADLIHGGALDKMRDAFPGAPRPWIDLSTGINPWPWSGGILHPDTLHRLPTADAMIACRNAMAEAINAPTESILLSPGSEILIRLLPSIIQPNRVAILRPTYGDHLETWQRAGADIVETDDPLAEAQSVDAIVLCNPNNPDGGRFGAKDLLQALDILQAKGGWMIIDEAYADLDPTLSIAAQGGAPGLILLRSIGKFFGLAGLRLGALIASSDILSAMSGRLGVWSLSGAAIEIGTSAYKDIEWQTQTRRRLKDARTKLDITLSAAGLTVKGGTDLFRFVKTEDAYELWDRLARQGIYVRRFAWNRQYLRIGLPQDDAALHRLAKAINRPRNI